MRLWRIGSPHAGLYAADDVSGEGARRAGARWNPRGTPALYAFYHPAAAVLETLVHIGHRKQPAVRYLVAIDVEDVQFSNPATGIVQLTLKDLPRGWNANPPDQVSQLFGAERFKRVRIGFAVPSAVVYEELNVVLNPLHPAFKAAVKAVIVRPFAFDPRF